jgi:hypothetical protein
MAFVNPAIDESEENKFGPTGTTTPSPEAPPDTGSTGAGAGAGGAGSAPTQATSTQFGSSASKLSDYLSANAPQIESMGSDIAGKFNTQYGQLQGDINKAGSDFGSAVSGGYAAANPDLVKRATSDPAGFVKNAGDVSAFQKQLNNAYTGPQNFESFSPYGKVQGDVSSAVQNAGLLGSSGGLSDYLKSKATGQYTPGMNTLDTTLLQANPNAQKMVTDATRQYGGLTDYLNQAVQSANKLVSPAQQSAQQSAKYARDQAIPVTQDFGNTLDTQLATTNKNRDAYNEAVRKNQTNAQDYQRRLLQAQQDAISKYTGNVRNMAGNPISGAEQNTRIGGLIDPQSQLSGLAQYLSGQPITQPGTLANTATAGQYGEDAALAQLLGADYMPRLNQEDIGQAGSYTVPAIGGTAQDPTGQIQYMNDIASLYGNPYGLTNANVPGGWKNVTPQQSAQAVIRSRPGQGVNPDAATIEALNRLISDQYAGRALAAEPIPSVLPSSPEVPSTGGGPGPGIMPPIPSTVTPPPKEVPYTGYRPGFFPMNRPDFG